MPDAKRTEVEDLESAADLIATNAAAALAFDDAINGAKLKGRSQGRNGTVFARPSGLQEVRKIIET